MESSLCAGLLMVSSIVALSVPSCDQTQFLDPNGTCLECPVCGPGEQLSEDCGFGDGGEGFCVECAEGQFSVETSLAPCWQCTQCNLLNRQERGACSPTSNAQCGQCVVGYYELRSMRGEIELLCMPCYSSSSNFRKECLHSQPTHTTTADLEIPISKRKFKRFTQQKTKTVPVSMVLIGSAFASSIFILVLLLWAFLLTFESLKQVPKSEGLFSGADSDSPQCSLLSDPVETGESSPGSSTQTSLPAEDLNRGLGSLSNENEVHPTSIVISVTANVKPSNQHEEDRPWEGQRSYYHMLEEMEQQLMKICSVAQGQSLESLDYDTVQDVSLLLGPGGWGSGLRRLGFSLGVPSEILTHLHSFQDLFQYLRTSTYTLLPQLAQAAALMPHPDIVSRIHRALVAKCMEAT
ncbi:tumor necrosis factor receptor superfamily member 27-like [Osmerus mordax]|uniref:tumor necrosis factor receptor superfamily member 27-like n=1 Tax=Osmerus mordax TaxID=8014 RepID=UPI0035106692